MPMISDMKIGVRLGLGFAVIVALVLTLGITKPLGDMVAMLHDIAKGEGDLTKRLDGSGKDEGGEASRHFNLFVDSIHDIISRTVDISAEIASASGQLSSIAGRIAVDAEEAMEADLRTSPRRKSGEMRSSA